MSTAEAPAGFTEEQTEKGLKPGALGLVSSIVMGVASTAPAYSLAATLGFIVAVVGLGSPIVAVIAFIPIFLTSIGYSELNKPTRGAERRSPGRRGRSGRRPG